MMSFENNPFLPPSPTSSASAKGDSKDSKARLEELKKKKLADEQEATKTAEAATGIIRMPVVVHRATFGSVNKVELLEFDNVAACEGAAVVMGIPGTNLTSVVSAGYLAKQLALPIVAEMRVPSLQPQGVVVASVPYQPVRIYGDAKLVVVQSELPITAGGMVHNLCAAILDFCARHKSRNLVLVEGIPTKPADLKDAERLRFVTTDEDFSRHMKSLNHLGIINGILGGLTGQLLADAPLADPPILGVTAIMAKVDANLPSAESAVHVVRALNSSPFLGEHKVDLTDLENSAFELETALQDAMKKAKAAQGPGERGGAPPSSMYM